MAPYVDLFAGGPDGSLGKAIADGYQAWQKQAAPSAPAAPVQNALLPGAAGALNPGGLQQGAFALPGPAPDFARTQLRSAVSHAALLADTPEKWAATLAMLKSNGIDPAGYEDFNKGRALALAASALAPQAFAPSDGADGQTA